MYLVGRQRHLKLAAQSQQQQAALGAGYGDLADDLLEALPIEFLTDGTDAHFMSLMQPMQVFGEIGSSARVLEV